MMRATLDGEAVEAETLEELIKKLDEKVKQNGKR